MKRILMVGLGVAAGLLVACDAIQSALPGSEPLPTLYVIPTLAPAEQAGGEAQAGGEGQAPGDLPSNINLDQSNQYGEPSGVSSYSVTLEFSSVVTAADGTTTEGLITVGGVRQVDPSATSLIFTAEGTADFGQGNMMTFTEVEGVDYMQLPTGECVSFPTGQTETPYSILLGSGGVLGDLEGAQIGVPPTETVNGVQTIHYTFDETDLNAADPTTGDIEEAQGDVYVALDGGYVVRVMMTGRGVSTLLDGSAEIADITYQLDYADFNQPVSIAPPDGCEGLPGVPAVPDGAGADVTTVPTLPDAVFISSGPGPITYTTQSGFDDVVAFYQTEMPAAGHTLEQEIGSSPNATMTFSGPEGTVQVNIAPAPDGSGGSLVGIVALP